MTGFVEAARREKLKELIERGVAPFAYRFERSATAKQALGAYRDDNDQTQYRLAGRLVALRQSPMRLSRPTFAISLMQNSRQRAGPQSGCRIKSVT